MGGVEARMDSDQVLALLRDGLDVGHDAEPTPPRRPGNWRGWRRGRGAACRRRSDRSGVDPGDAVEGRELGGVGGDRRVGVHRRRGRPTGKASASLDAKSVRRAGRWPRGRVALGQHPVVGRSEAAPGGTAGRGDQQRHHGDGHHDGPSHDPRRRCGARTRCPTGRRLPVADDPPAIDPRAEHGQQGGEREQRGQHRDQRDPDAGPGEGAEEVEREDEQGRQRHAHRQRAEGDRPAGGLDGADDRRRRRVRPACSSSRNRETMNRE